MHTWSNHAPISITIEDSNLQRNTYLWRAHNYVLQHEKYSPENSDHLAEFFALNKGSVSDPGMVSSTHKAYIRGLLIKLSSLHKKRTQLLDELTSQIMTLEQQHKANPQTPQTDKLLSLRQELKTLLLNSFDLLQCKLKATTYSTSNNAGKRLAERLKGRGSKTKILQLIHPHTKLPLTDPQDIANAFRDYYSDLYNLNQDPQTPQPSLDVINQFLQSIHLPTLTGNQLETLNAPFTEQEIKVSINSLPNGKAPGPDGLTGEYYKQFSAYLIPHITEVFNNTASSSKFHYEYLNALIIMIPKPGKEPNAPQNFRPISLLNLDLKMYAKTITA